MRQGKGWWNKVAPKKEEVGQTKERELAECLQRMQSERAPKQHSYYPIGRPISRSRHWGTGAISATVK